MSGIYIGIVISLISAVIIFYFIKIKKISLGVLSKIYKINGFVDRKKILKRPRHVAFFQDRVTQTSDSVVNPPLFGVLAPPTKIPVYYRNAKFTSTVKLPKKYKRSKLFFENALCDFSYTITSPFVNSERTGKLEYKDRAANTIVDKIIRPCIESGEAQVVCLYGKIGCGKSTLIGSIKDEAGKKII